MLREIPRQDVEELHQARGDVLGSAQVRCEGTVSGNPPHEPVGRVRLPVPAAGGRAPDPEEARGYGVRLRRVELVELALAIDQHDPLQRFLGVEIVSHNIMREIVEHLEGEEEARRRHRVGPVEDAPVDDLDPVGVTPASGG